MSTAGRPYDVAIIGAGPAGSATALRLRAAGVGRVLLAESSRFDKERIGESVPPDFRELLRELGVLDAFLAGDHAHCLGSASSWGSEILGYNDFLTHSGGAGRHLDRTRFDAFLAAEASKRGADLRRGWRFTRAQRRRSGGYRLEFRTDDGESRNVEAEVVVDAAGRAAPFARFAGGAVRRFADRLTCIAGRFAVTPVATGLGKTTWLEAVETGWWYGAELSGGRAVVAVTSDPAICRRLGLTDPERFLGRLARTRHLAGRLDGCAFSPRSLSVHAAHSSRLDPIHGSDWLAVGDAAGAFDPLSSQGIYQAVAGGLAAGQAIVAGGRDAFAEYARGRQRTYDEYLKLRSHLYGLETRWPEASFWRRRLVSPSFSPN